MKSAKYAAFHGLLIALAMIISYVESLIPVFTSIPGVKIGLTNVVIITALYLFGWKSALIINIIRIVLVGISFGNAMSLACSLAGGIFSFIAMVLLKKTGKFGIIPVSAVGGVAHNTGQIIAVILMLQTTAFSWYLPILWFSGIISGIITGILGGILCKRLKNILKF